MLEPKNSDKLRAVFNKLVQIAKQKFGKDPCVELVDNETPYEKYKEEGVDDPDDLIDTKPGFERATLSAFVVVDTKVKERGKYMTMTETENIRVGVGILESEIFTVKELVRNYEQPDDFDPNVDYWADQQNDYWVDQRGTYYKGFGPEVADGKGNATLVVLAYLHELAATEAALKEMLYNENMTADEIVDGIAKHRIII